MKPSEFFKREIERRELDVTYEIGLLEDLDERFIDKQEFDKKLEQLKKKPQRVSSFDEHKAHLIEDIDKMIEDAKEDVKNTQVGYTLQEKEYYKEELIKLEELKKKIKELKI